MGNSMVIKNGNVLLADGSLAKKDVLIINGKISAISDNLSADKTLEADGNYVIPGLIDLHCHGIGYESSSDSLLSDMAALEAKEGATTFFPTLFAPPEVVCSQIKRHRKESQDFKLTPQIVGFRLESPYLHHAGGGLTTNICDISDEVTNMILDAAQGTIKIWDIAPELTNAPETINRLSNMDICCSFAHTYASIEQAKICVDAGAGLVTHLYDTFALPVQTEGGVYPASLVDYLLMEDRICVEIIGDGTHVPPLNVEKAFRCKPSDKITFVTDSNLGAGLEPGDYELPGGWGVCRVNGPNNGVRLVERNMGLSGSALTPINSLRNCISMFGKDIAAASRVCSTNQAKLLGLNKGEIKIGKDADIIILNKDLGLQKTICAGEVIYSK